MILARADFVNVDRRLHQRWTLNHFVIAVWRAKRQNAGCLNIGKQYTAAFFELERVTRESLKRAGSRPENRARA